MRVGSGGNGFDTRYDDDLGGNHIQRERDKCKPSKFVFSHVPSRLCAKCKKKKPVKGGSGIGTRFGFVCADCKALE